MGNPLFDTTIGCVKQCAEPVKLVIPENRHIFQMATLFGWRAYDIGEFIGFLNQIGYIPLHSVGDNFKAAKFGQRDITKQSQFVKRKLNQTVEG